MFGFGKSESGDLETQPEEQKRTVAGDIERLAIGYASILGLAVAFKVIQEDLEKAATNYPSSRTMLHMVNESGTIPHGELRKVGLIKNSTVRVPRGSMLAVASVIGSNIEVEKGAVIKALHVSEDSKITEIEPEERMVNCENCGAALNNSLKCEYCGSQF